MIHTIALFLSAKRSIVMAIVVSSGDWGFGDIRAEILYIIGRMGYDYLCGDV